ncbi:MAG: LytTR family transcriptional regulator [Bacteroidales bacterium]|nr:LytTR family transcriptional regulator [Bacteroidales bacterium]
MPRKRIILFLGILSFLMLVPTLMTSILSGLVLPWWACLLSVVNVLILAGMYLVERLWLIDHFLVRGRIWQFVLASLMLVVLGTAAQYVTVGIADRHSIGGGLTVADFLGKGLLISHRIIILILSALTVLFALAVALSDEWRLAAFKYREAERDKHALARERDALKGQVDSLQRPAAEPEYISVKVDLMMTQIRLDDILYVKSDGDYIVLHLADGRAPMVLMTLKALEKQIPFDRFCRIHRSYLVAIDKVQGLQGGKILVNGETLPLSDSCKPAFFELLSLKSIILSSSGQE